MYMVYTEEEIISTLRSVAKVKNLNQISAPVVVKDILPDYPDKKMANWAIGYFLFNSRNGCNAKHYDILHELGFSFYKSGLISQINIVCEAIDELAEAGVDLNNIPIKAKMSDYIKKYHGSSYNFSIGVTLENARRNRECKAVVSKLKEHNFDFSSISVTKEGIIKKIVVDVAKVTDLRTIPAKATVKDFLPKYDPKLADFNIGILIQNVRAGSYKFLLPTLNELGFSFEKVRHKSQSSTICNIIDDLIDNNIDINSIGSHAVVGDLIPGHPNKDFCIGKYLRNAALGNVGQVAKKKLEESGFTFTPRTLTHEQKIAFVAEVAKHTKLSSVNKSALLGDVLPGCDEKYAWWKIGKFLEDNRRTHNPKYKAELKNLGLRYYKKEKKHTADFAIQAIRDLVEENVDLNSIKQRAKMSDYIKSYSHDDFLIGALLSNARAQKTSESVADELAMHNFDFTQKPVTITLETKVNILKRLVDSGVDINSILPKHRLSSFIELGEGERDYRIGLWIDGAEKNKQNNQLLEELVKLGYMPKDELKR